MVVHIVNVERVAVGTVENHAPVRTHGHRVKTLLARPSADAAGNPRIHVDHGLGRVEASENIAQLRYMLGQYAARVVVFVKFQSPPEP
jgi:hypothetical protein